MTEGSKTTQSPALDWLLAEETSGLPAWRDITWLPGGCAGCPFSSVDPHATPPNPADPDEGYYDCALLGKKAIWGENPICEPEHWRARARQELANRDG